MIYDVIIIGAGASGLMCALELEKESINYLVLEKNNIPGKKILISGGTRCNVTNNLDVDDFINSLTLKNKKFLYPALYTMGPSQVIQFFKENNLSLKLENDFKYFPITNKSQSIVDVLLDNIDKNKILYQSNVRDVKLLNAVFEINTDDKKYQTRKVVVATGSKSFPKTGSTGFGLKVAKKHSISYQDFTSAETHVYSNQIMKNYADLQGTTITNTTVEIKGTKIRHQGDLLFTHFGLSGPVIYHISEFLAEDVNRNEIIFALTSKDEKDTIMDFEHSPNTFVLKMLEQCVSKRVAKKILQVTKIPNKKIAELSKKDIQQLLDFLYRFSVQITKVEDKEKAYVNKGGILLNELHPTTMESKKVKGLYFTGETVAVHGPIGGFNITIAFATGVLAALNIIEGLNKEKI